MIRLEALTPRERETLSHGRGILNAGIAFVSVTEGTIEKTREQHLDEAELTESQDDHRRVSPSSPSSTPGNRSEAFVAEEAHDRADSWDFGTELHGRTGPR
jgi:hypothetical protein